MIKMKIIYSSNKINSIIKSKYNNKDNNNILTKLIKSNKLS